MNLILNSGVDENLKRSHSIHFKVKMRWNPDTSLKPDLKLESRKSVLRIQNRASDSLIARFLGVLNDLPQPALEPRFALSEPAGG